MRQLQHRLLSTVASVALVVSGGAAAAQDLPVPSWTGFYVGGHVGGAGMNVDGLFNPSELPGNPWGDDSSIVGGGHAGFNWQNDSFVYGLEVDVSGTDYHTVVDHLAGSESAQAEIDLLASARARLGMAFTDVTLIYVTGGVAFRHGNWDAFGDSGLDGGDDDLDKFGGVIGAGGEFMVTPHLSVGGEVLWYIFGENEAPPDCCNTVGSNFDSDPIVGRVRASFHFF